MCKIFWTCLDWTGQMVVRRDVVYELRDGRCRQTTWVCLLGKALVNNLTTILLPQGFTRQSLVVSSIPIRAWNLTRIGSCWSSIRPYLQAAERNLTKTKWWWYLSGHQAFHWLGPSWNLHCCRMWSWIPRSQYYSVKVEIFRSKQITKNSTYPQKKMKHKLAAIDKSKTNPSCGSWSTWSTGLPKGGCVHRAK